MSRWEELMKQPKAKRITVHNQLDDIDTRGKKFLISDRVTPSFDSFVTDVNEKLAPHWSGSEEDLHSAERPPSEVCERPDGQQGVHSQPQEV